MSNSRYPEEFKLQAVNQAIEKKNRLPGAPRPIGGLPYWQGCGRHFPRCPATRRRAGSPEGQRSFG